MLDQILHLINDNDKILLYYQQEHLLKILKKINSKRKNIKIYLIVNNYSD